MTVLTTEKLGATVGAQVLGVDRDRLLDDDAFPEWCLRVLDENGALVFRDLHLDDETQVAFSRKLGRVELGRGDRPEIFRVTLDPAKNPVAEYLRGTFDWHLDGATDDIPIMATVLSAHAVATSGGETEFASTYAAYDALSAVEQHELLQVRVVHSLEAAQRLVNPDPSSEELATWRKRPAKVHPLVWQHRSGRRSLVLGATASHVEDMAFDDGPRCCSSCSTAPPRPSSSTATSGRSATSSSGTTAACCTGRAGTTRRRRATCIARRSPATSRSNDRGDRSPLTPLPRPYGHRLVGTSDSVSEASSGGPPDVGRVAARPVVGRGHAGDRPLRPPDAKHQLPRTAAAQGSQRVGHPGQPPGPDARVPRLQRAHPLVFDAHAPRSGAAHPAGGRAPGRRLRGSSTSSIASGAGIADEEIERVAAGPTHRGGRSTTPRCCSRSTSWSRTRVSDVTWGKLAETFDTQQLMDFVFTVGAYDLLAMAFRSFGIELDADLAPPAS